LAESFETTNSTEAISKAIGMSSKTLIFEGAPDGFPSLTPDVDALPDAVSDANVLSVLGHRLEERRARMEMTVTDDPSATIDWTDPALERRCDAFTR
jgi:hypothetical protein